MDFKELISRLQGKDEAVTRCFFFWDGPTLERIEEIRLTDPERAAQLPRPVCATAKPVLLKTLCRVYGPGNFDYLDLVTDLYHHIMVTDVLSKLSEPSKLMGYLAVVAYHYWLGEKKKSDQLLENPSADTLFEKGHDIEDNSDKLERKRFVQEVLAAMPNRSYARLLDDDVLEISGLSGAEKAERTRQAAQRLGIPVEHLYVRVSLAKKQFKATALRIIQGRL